MALAFPYHVDVAVRGYELDGWSHVNNAVYLHYLEHARWEMARHAQVGRLQDGILTVVRHVTLDYVRETVQGDVLRVSLWPRAVGTTSMTFGGAIHVVQASDPARAGILALRATQVLTCVRRPGGKVPVPDNWRALFPASDPGELLPSGT